jgi:hypothetical protein
MAELVVGETTCDGKKKMFELLNQIQPVYVMEVPNKKTERSRQLWYGEVLAFNHDDGFLYHWSGNGTALMEKIDTGSFVATPVVQTGQSHNEIFGAVYKGGGEFYTTDISSSSLTITAGGFVTVVATGLPDDIRGLGYGDVVLPVELASFTSSINGRNVSLSWTTSSEVNNSRFVIQRRTSGEETGSQWKDAGHVNGNGTTGTPSTYSFTDRGLNSGSYSYRLKQIDFNGNFEYFELGTEVNIGIPVHFDLSQNYPNPFNPSTKINFDVPVDSKVMISVFDISGRLAATVVDGFLPAGYHTVNFSSAGLSSGVYFYRLTASGNGNEFSAVKKMTLIK